MSPKKKYKITSRETLSVFFLLICLLLPALSFAQGPDDPNDAPIDGGVSLLLAAGAAYGIKKYRSGKIAMQKNRRVNNDHF